MAHELWLLKNNTMTNITPLIGALSWRSNIDELGDELTFSIAFNDDKKLFPKNPCNIGDLIILKNNEEINRFIIVDETKNGRSPISYVCYDYAFYLNKSSGVYQFKKLNAHDCIKKVAKDFGVPIGTIMKMPVPISKIYVNETGSEIIKDILSVVESKMKTKTLMEIRKGKLNIEKRSNQLLDATFDLAKNLKNSPVQSAIANPTRRRQIVDMINSIQVVKDDKLVYQTSDKKMIEKYGKLQKIISMSSDEKTSASQLAKTELANLSKVIEESSLEMMGSDKARAGRLLEISEPVTGMKGKYLIKDVGHTVENGIHKMAISLELV